MKEYFRILRYGTDDQAREVIFFFTQVIIYTSVIIASLIGLFVLINR